MQKAGFTLRLGLSEKDPHFIARIARNLQFTYPQLTETPLEVIIVNRRIVRGRRCGFAPGAIT